MVGDGIVAKPIAETPTLRGKDAARFLAELEQERLGNRKLSPEKLAKLRESFEKISRGAHI